MRPMFARINEKQWLALILVFALLARSATAFALQFQPVSDYAGYEQMAMNLVAGKGLVEGAIPHS